MCCYYSKFKGHKSQSFRILRKNKCKIKATKSLQEKTQWSKPENTQQTHIRYFLIPPLIMINKYFIIKIILNIQQFLILLILIVHVWLIICTKRYTGGIFELGRNYKYKWTFLNNFTDVRITIIKKLSQKKILVWDDKYSWMNIRPLVLFLLFSP